MNQEDELCTDAKGAGLSCPIQPGNKSISTTGKFPAAPSVSALQLSLFFRDLNNLLVYRMATRYTCIK